MGKNPIPISPPHGIGPILGDILTLGPPCLTVTVTLFLVALIIAIYMNYGEEIVKSELKSDFDATKALEFIRERRSIFPKNYSG